ncbi:hypothetical protein WV31_10790 [Magnetospirillum sp. ME-1]|uniref:hypothetical protein n=1 Tax=Magnetospirillum sp. ME-1 TaxID=1639348 RepID=UPI000A17DA97|nr:hypothetical protein [Magnetospirillum sp. ME-1]ARJ66114.1 hypothetical protein WV31_10790 [Magnetospirillum sp. ME-1]
MAAPTDYHEAVRQIIDCVGTPRERAEIADGKPLKSLGDFPEQDVIRALRRFHDFCRDEGYRSGGLDDFRPSWLDFKDGSVKVSGDVPLLKRRLDIARMLDCHVAHEAELKLETPGLSPKEYERLASLPGDAGRNVRFRLCTDPRVPPDLLSSIALDHSSLRRLALSNPAMGPKGLARIAARPRMMADLDVAALVKRRVAALDPEGRKAYEAEHFAVSGRKPMEGIQVPGLRESGATLVNGVLSIRREAAMFYGQPVRPRTTPDKGMGR